MYSERRQDLLSYLERYAWQPRREVVRAEAWRSRGWSWGRIAAEAEAVARGLAASGVVAEDRVALHLNDGPPWHAAFFGVLRAGAVAVPFDASLEPDLLRRFEAELDLRAWCTEREVPDLKLDLPRIELDWHEGVVGEAADNLVGPLEWPEDDPNRIAQIVLTSGTTGPPSAVPVSHSNIGSVLRAIEGGVDEYRLALRAAPTIRIAVSLPLSHLYGQVMGVFLPALIGADVSVVPSMPAPEMVRVLRNQRAWLLASVPRTLTMLGEELRRIGEARWGAAGMSHRMERALERPWIGRWPMFFRLRRRLGLRFIAVTSGGAALDRETEDLWRALGYPMIQGYGLTETAPLVTLNHPFRIHPGSLGRPLPGVELRIAQDGEILVRGPNVVGAAGSDAVDAQGWLHTGDLGRLDQAANLYYLGRKGDRVVTSAGINIDLGPIAESLRAQEGVIDALAIERPWGSAGSVCVILLMGPAGDPERAVANVNRDLPDAARIRSWHQWPEADFPRTHTGKPRLQVITDWLIATTSEPAEPSGGPTDTIGAVSRLVADIAGVSSESMDVETPLGEVLSSLDRVDLATRLELAYGTTPGPEVFVGERSVAELADELVTASGRQPQDPGTIEEPVEKAPLSVPESRWRFWPPVRAARYVLRETIMRPLWAGFFDVDVGGLDHLEGIEPPYIIAANHLSIFDPGAVLFSLPRHHRTRVASAAMWQHFVRRRTGAVEYPLAVFGLNLIPLVHSGDWRPTLRVAGAIADRGGSVLIYPEGGRSLDGALLPLRPGVAVMARDLHLPIVPCAAAGLLSVLPTGSLWPRGCWFRRAPLAVRFGEPLRIPKASDDLSIIVAELHGRVESLLADAHGAAGRF